MCLLLEEGSDSAECCSTGQMYSPISNDPNCPVCSQPNTVSDKTKEVGEVGGAISKTLFANSMKQTVMISIYMLSGYLNAFRPACIFASQSP